MKTTFVLRLAGLALATLASALPSLRAQETAWAWIQPAGQGASWTPGGAYQHSTTGGTATVARVTGTTNRFRVTFPGFTDGTGVVLVSAYGGSHTPVVNGWGLSGSDLQATVTTFDAGGGAAADGAFTITYRVGGGGRNAFLWANQSGAASYTPSTIYSWNGANADPTITRSAPGSYRVRLPGLAPPFSEEGHVQVSSYGLLARRTTVEGWYPSGGDMIVDVLTTDMAGAPTDTRFTLSYNEYAVPIADVEGSGAHVWANDPVAASYTPAAPYTDSNGRVGPNDAERIRRLGVGEYVVDLPDCAASSRVASTARRRRAPTSASAPTAGCSRARRAARRASGRRGRSSRS